MGPAKGCGAAHGRSARCRLGCMLGVLLLGHLAGARGQAQPTVERQAYDEAIRHAVEEYRLEHWMEAKAYFARAHALRPNARTSRGLGLASFELRTYVEAIAHFRRALAGGPQPLTQAMRAQVERLLKDAEAFIALRGLVLEPPGSAVSVDGQPPVYDADARLMLDPGVHQLVFSAPGYRTEVRTVRAEPGETRALRITLPPTNAAPPAPTQARATVAETSGARWPAPAGPPRKQVSPTTAQGSHGPGALPLDAAEPGGGSTQRWAAVVAGGAGAVGLSASALLGALAATKNRTSNENCEPDNRCSQQGYDDRKTARALGDAATVSAVAGVILLGTGLVLHFTAHEDAAASGPAMALSPALSPEHLGVRWMGSL